jgi:NAD-dependent SIR2 family protein deacetylase
MGKFLNERSGNIIMLNLETVILKIQDIFKTRVVTIVGSGLSASHGLPGMRELAQTLLASDFKLESQNSVSQWNDIKKSLSNGVDRVGTINEQPRNRGSFSRLQSCRDSS